jgi:nicotinate phosphoribosyltransferase
MAQPGLSLANRDLGLFADLYEFTMAQAFYRQGMFAPATFSLFVRHYPPNRGFLVTAGLADVLDFLSELHFDRESLDYLESTGIFTRDFLGFLGELRFTGSVRAIPEGRLVFPNEPVLEITAPLIEAQMVETFVINQINLQTMLATKASRCAIAAQGRTLSDFSARRTQGTDAAMKMARCGYIGGFESTSNVLAARRYGIPPAGTMAHSFISTFPTEVEAFRAYAETYPDRCVLLLDTYDTVQGSRNAVQVGKEMELRGHRLVAVRLDSGDYAELSRQVRAILDDAGLSYVRILASGGLDEFSVRDLVDGGAPIDIFGVGTKVGTSADAPWSDMAYKLVCYDDRPTMKLSADKVSLPGPKQVFRFQGSNGTLDHDVLGLLDEEMPGGEPLLAQVMSNGIPSSPAPTLDDARRRMLEDLVRLSGPVKALTGPSEYPVRLSSGLDALSARVRSEVQGES